MAGGAEAMQVISVYRGALFAPGHLLIVAFEKLYGSRLGILRWVVGVSQMSGDNRALFQEQKLARKQSRIRQPRFFGQVDHMAFEHALVIGGLLVNDVIGVLVLG